MEEPVEPVVASRLAFFFIIWKLLFGSLISHLFCRSRAHITTIPTHAAMVKRSPWSQWLHTQSDGEGRLYSHGFFLFYLFSSEPFSFDWRTNERNGIEVKGNFCVSNGHYTQFNSILLLTFSYVSLCPMKSENQMALVNWFRGKRNSWIFTVDCSVSVLDSHCCRHAHGLKSANPIDFLCVSRRVKI